MDLLGILTTKPTDRLGVRQETVLSRSRNSIQEVQLQGETASANPAFSPRREMGGMGHHRFYGLEPLRGGASGCGDW